MYEIEILRDTRNHICWNVDQYVPKQIGNFDIVGHGKTTIHLVPEGKTYRERISISKKAVKVIRAIKGEKSKPSDQELKRRASKCFTNAGDAMIALQELKRRKGL